MSVASDVRAPSPTWLAYFIDVLHARFGLVTNEARRSMVENAVLRVTEDLGLASPPHLLALVQEGALESDAVRALLRHVTVHESYFFRDDRAIAELRATVLPALIAARRDRRRLRVWSAGCAGGEEAYTLAILLRSFSELDRWELDILGTDLDPHVVERARTGLFAGGSLRACTAEDLARHFEPVDGRSSRIRETYRQIVRFEVDNLMDPALDSANGAFDLVMCRNVALYFDRDGTTVLHRKIARYLADDGVALLGVLEPRPLEALVPAETHTPGIPLYERETRDALARFRVADTVRPGLENDAHFRSARTWNPSSRRAPSAYGERDARRDGARSARAVVRSAPVEATAPTASQGVDALIALAETHADEGRSDAALDLARTCIDEHPLDPRGYLLAAMVWSELDRHDHAEMFLRRVLYLTPESADAHQRLALVLTRRGDTAGAARALGEAQRCARRDGGTSP